MGEGRFNAVVFAQTPPETEEFQEPGSPHFGKVQSIAKYPFFTIREQGCHRLEGGHGGTGKLCKNACIHGGFSASSSHKVGGMRIMLVHAPSPIVRELCRRGHEVLSSNSTVRYDTHEDLPPEWAPKQRSANFGGRKKVSWEAIRSLRKLVREFRPEVLHAFTPASLAWSVLGTSGLLRRPRLLSFRGIPRLLRHSDPSDWISFLSPRVVLHACESKAVMLSMVRSGIPRHRCRVIYNVAWDFDDSKSPEDWKKEWGIPEDAIVIGSVGHIRPIKGFDVLLEAARRLVDLPQWRLVIGGDVDDPKVRSLAETEELRHRLVLPGRITNAPNAMRAFHVFVMPSRSEGLCRALIEAMSMGVCPIVSEAGGMKELVRHGRDGLVFPIDDVPTLAGHLRTVMEDGEARVAMAASAQQHVRLHCDVAIVADKLEAMYHEALSTDWDEDFDETNSARSET